MKIEQFFVRTKMFIQQYLGSNKMTCDGSHFQIFIHKYLIEQNK
jgi:hypothetical protein